jgi:hypothetical protein
MGKITAVQEAQIAKREIEKYIKTEFAKFSENTGLLVDAIDIEAIETTALNDEFRKFGAYRVEVQLKIP